MKTEITVHSPGIGPGLVLDYVVAPPRVSGDWEAFARTDGSVCVTERGHLYERVCGAWFWRRLQGDGGLIPSKQVDDYVAARLQSGTWQPVHIDITWRMIK